MEKKIEVRKRMRKEVRKELELKVEVEKRLKKECDELREENLRLKDTEKLKGKVADMKKDEKERIKELEMKVELEVGLRKKAEEELEVWTKKFFELESKVFSLTKDVDSLRGLKAGAQGSEMEAGAEVQATVRSPHNQFVEGASSLNPLSAAKHGLGNCIEISSSSDDDASELQVVSKDKSDLAPVKLDFESVHGSPEVSLRLKRKHMSSINEDKTESIPQPSTGDGILPKLSIQEGADVQPSLTPPLGFSIPKYVNSGQAEGTSRGSKVSLDDEQYKKSFLEKLKLLHWDDGSSDSSSDF